MPQPDCFIRHRMCCNAEFYYVRKIPPAATHGLKMVLRPTAAATHGFTIVLVTVSVSRRNNFVGGTYALPTDLLVIEM